MVLGVPWVPNGSPKSVRCDQDSFLHDLWLICDTLLTTHFVPLAQRKPNSNAKGGPQEMPGKRYHKRCRIRPSKSSEIMLPCTREHSFHRDAMCRKGSLKLTLLRSYDYLCVPRTAICGPQWPSCTRRNVWSDSRGPEPTMEWSPCPSALACRIPVIYRYIYIYMLFFVFNFDHFCQKGILA